MERGLIDAALGGGVFKKRVALEGRGKSGGARTIVITNRGDRWFFVYGFEKNERDNISLPELDALRIQAYDYLRLSTLEIESHIKRGALEEISDDNQDEETEIH
jgi:hypothetical protein